MSLITDKKLLNKVFYSHLAKFQELYDNALKDNKSYLEFQGKRFTINYSKNLLEYFKKSLNLPNLTKH
jgi:hypothetical protein